VLMGDRPALTPVEGFYQRILANDLDETQDHAEVFLKDQPLSAYYDNVAIQGLRLAANDAERGVLTPRQLRQIQNTMPRLLKELDDGYAVSPILAESSPAELTGSESDPPVVPGAETVSIIRPPSAAPNGAVVLCISGRDILDEPVADMLAQLLHQNGVQARVVTFDAASRENVVALNVVDVVLVCITYLQLSGGPSHLRYLIRRIRSRLPTVPILVGLWPVDELVVLDETRLLTAVGADDYATSLTDLVKKCQVIAGGSNSSTALPEPGS